MVARTALPTITRNNETIKMAARVPTPWTKAIVDGVDRRLRTVTICGTTAKLMIVTFTYVWENERYEKIIVSSLN